MVKKQNILMALFYKYISYACYAYMRNVCNKCYAYVVARCVSVHGQTQ